MFKTCFKCKRRKTIDKFYTHPRMADGHLNKCTACTKKDVNERYANPLSKLKIKRYERARNRTPERRAAKKIYQIRRRELRPGRERAHYAVSNAVRDGRLIKLPCEVCGIRKVEAHHDDYRRPLAVRWLCFKHHRQEHGQQVE